MPSRHRCLASLFAVSLSSLALAGCALDAPASTEPTAADQEALFGIGDTSLTGFNKQGGYPQVARNARGDAIIVWAARPVLGNGAATIDYVYRPAGGSFTSPRTLATLDVRAVFPNVRLNDRGDAVVAWPSVTQSGVYAAVGSPSRGTWSSPVKISRDDQGLFTAQDLVSLAIDANGNAIATYSQLVATYSARYSTATRAWDTPIVLPEGADAKSLTLLSSGDAYLYGSTWIGDSTLPSSWMSAIYQLPRGAGTWQTARQLAHSFIPRWFSPDCAGRLVAFGSAFDPATSTWGFAVRAISAGGAETTYHLPAALEWKQVSGNNQHEQTAVCEPNGNVTILYTATTGPDGQASRYVGTATWAAATGLWSSPERLSNGGIAIALRVSPRGKVAASWLRPVTGSQPFEVRFRPQGGAWGRTNAVSSFFAWDNTGDFVGENEFLATWQRSFDGVGITGGKLFAKIVAAQ